MLRKSKGNMYGFVTHTWNPIKGKCIHNCCYCYMKRFPQRDLRIDKSEFKTDLGIDNYIFIGSSTDIFAEDVKDKWIKKTFDKCKQHRNKYLFQSKNTMKMAHYVLLFPKNSVIGTTIETNRDYALSEAPNRKQRAIWLRELGKSFETMVTIEPIFDFDLKEFVSLIKEARPKCVNIGADSNNKKDYKYPEPSQDKVIKLIEELKKFTEVRKKYNLNRLLPLDVKQEGGNGVPPTLKSVGIPPTIL